MCIYNTISFRTDHFGIQKKVFQKQVRIVARLAVLPFLLFWVRNYFYIEAALYKMYLKSSFIFGLVDPCDPSWMFLKQITRLE